MVHRHQHVVRIFGTRGTFVYDDEGPRVHKSREASAAATRIDLSPLPSTKGVLIPEFVQSILEGRDCSKEIQHEFNVITCCLAADKAVGTSATEEIEYV